MNQRGLTLTTLLMLVAISGHSSAQAVAHDYLVVEYDHDQGSVSVVSRQIVALPGNAPLKLASQASGLRGGTKSNGATWSHQLPLKPAYLEVPPAPGATQIERIEDPISRFVLRVPADAERIAFTDPLRGIDLTIDHGKWRNQEALTIPSSSVRAEAATSDNRIKLLIMGDGFTANLEDFFFAQADRVADQFFAIEPYRSYRNLFNVVSLFTPSRETGADHTGCDNSDTRTADTAFDAQFCTAGIARLLTVNELKVLQAAAAVPDWDQILLLVNDLRFGGSGGTFAVFSRHEIGIDVAHHEFGHSFTLLADEYVSGGPADSPSCSETLGSRIPCEPNVTDETARERLKWKHFIEPDTPLPTPANFAGRVGLFEGARYRQSDIYRPKSFCLMREFNVPFCPVCSEAFVARLYQGAFSNGQISLIEPASRLPLASELQLTVGEVASLSANILQPSADSPLAIRWLVNGKSALLDSTAADFVFAEPGEYEIALEVQDQGQYIGSAQLAQQARFQEIWRIQVAGASAWSPGSFDSAKPKPGTALPTTPVPLVEIQ